MKKKLVLKTLYMNVFIIYSAYIFMGFIDYEWLMRKEPEILFVLMGIIFLVTKSWGMLGELVRLDYPLIQRDFLIKFADNLEIFLAIGFVCLIFVGVYVPELSLLWNSVFLISYGAYLVFHVYYMIYRKKYINDSSPH